MMPAQPDELGLQHSIFVVHKPDIWTQSDFYLVAIHHHLAGVGKPQLEPAVAQSGWPRSRHGRRRQAACQGTDPGRLRVREHELRVRSAAIDAQRDAGTSCRLDPAHDRPTASR